MMGAPASDGSVEIQRGNVMAGDTKSAHELPSEELDTVTGGSVSLGSAIANGGRAGGAQGGTGGGGGGGKNDPAIMMQTILQQLTQQG